MRQRVRVSAAERGIPLAMSFEQALKKGDLDVARAILDELIDLPDTGGLWMPECYADLAPRIRSAGSPRRRHHIA
jgi:hypothetical protein